MNHIIDDIQSYKHFKEEWEQYCEDIAKQSLSSFECAQRRTKMKGLVQTFEMNIIRESRTQIDPKSLAVFDVTLDNALSKAKQNYRKEILIPKWTRWTAITLATLSAISTVAAAIIIYLLKR